MRHGMSYRKLGRTSGHRAAMFRNQLASIIEHERIVTTLPKAKELRPLIEKLVTLSRDDSVHNRRQAARQVLDDAMVQKLFATIAPRFTDRPGGYTRIVKLGPRRGDGTEMAILEFIDYELGKAPASSTPAKGEAKAARKATKADDAASGDEETAEEKPKKKKTATKSAPAKSGGARKAATAKKPASSKKAAPKKGATRGAKKGS
jgi:large subunit ribosomal protein L17